MRAPLLAFAIAAAMPSLALAAGFYVNIDQATRVTLSRPARDVIVGNPGIADVNMLDARHLVVTGKSYGVTNLVVTGPSGRTILSRQIVVGAPAAGQVTMHRGVDVAQYACAPRCERALPTGPTPAPAPAQAGP